MAIDPDKYVPSRGLAMLQGLAKGYGAHAKRLEQQELIKNQQYAEMMKLILPQFMRQQGEERAFQREKPFKEREIGVKESDLDLRLADLEQRWKIAQLESTDKTELAKIRAQLDVDLKGIDLKIEEWRNATANFRASMMSGATIEAAQIGAASREKVSAAGATSREKIAADKNTLDKELAKGKMPEGLKEDYRAFQSTIALVSPWLITAMSDPEKAPAAQIMLELIESERKKLGVRSAPYGGEPASIVPQIEEIPTRDRFWGPFPRIFGTVPGESEFRPVAPEAAPKAIPENLPQLKTSGADFDAIVKAMGGKKLSPEGRTEAIKRGLDPDALDKAAAGNR